MFAETWEGAREQAVMRGRGAGGGKEETMREGVMAILCAEFPRKVLTNVEDTDRTCGSPVCRNPGLRFRRGQGRGLNLPSAEQTLSHPSPCTWVS